MSLDLGRNEKAGAEKLRREMALTNNEAKTQLERFLQEIAKENCDRFKRRNDRCLSPLAGILAWASSTGARPEVQVDNAAIKILAQLLESKFDQVDLGSDWYRRD